MRAGVQQGLGTEKNDPGECLTDTIANGVTSGKKEQSSQVPRLRPIDRKQNRMIAVDVDSLVAQDHVVRAIWELVGRLDLSEFRSTIKSVEGEAGRSAYDPRLLISIWIFAYSEGWGAAREISRNCEFHPALQWLTGMEPVSYHTLSSFRISYKEKLDQLFAEFLAVLQAEEMVDLTRMFHDGSKIRANASSSSFHREQTLKENLELAKNVISELEKNDSEESNQRVRAAKKRAAEEKRERLHRSLEEFQKLKPTTKRKHATRVSQTDPESRNMIHSGGGYGPAYNAQVSTEGKNGFIIAADLSQCSADSGELTQAVENVAKNTGVKPKEAVVDSGFTNKKNIVQLSRQQIEIIGPLLPQASTVEQLHKRGVDPAFSKDHFTFDAENNQYICPAGKIVSYVSTRMGKASLEHLYRASGTDCRSCIFKEKCCGKAKRFRRNLVRTEDLPEVTAFKERMETDQAKEIYKLRSRFSEFPFAWIKEVFGLRRFHLRGKIKSLIELTWAVLTFNVLWYIRLKKLPA